MEWIKEEIELSKLIPNDENPRLMSGEDFEKLKSRIQDIGFYSVLVIDNNNVILSGNQRYKALKELNYEKTTVLKPSKKLTKAERDKIILSCNSHDGEWDIRLLSELNFDPAILTEFDLDSLVINFDQELEDLEFKYMQDELEKNSNEFFIRLPFPYDEKDFIEDKIKKYSKKALADKFVGMLRNL